MTVHDEGIRRAANTMRDAAESLSHAMQGFQEWGDRKTDYLEELMQRLERLHEGKGTE